MAVRAEGELRKDGQPAEKPGPDPQPPSAEQREMVMTLAGRGVSERQIGAILGRSRDWVVAHCKEELEKGRATAVANVAGVVYGAAMKGEYRHAALFLTNVGGWTNGRQQVEVSKSLEDLVKEAEAKRLAQAQAGEGGA